MNLLKHSLVINVITLCLKADLDFQFNEQHAIRQVHFINTEKVLYFDKCTSLMQNRSEIESLN